MKMGIIIAKHAVFKLAKRASGMGDMDMVAKDRIMTLIRERDDLQKEVAKLKRQLGTYEETPSNMEETRDDDWTTGKEEVSAKSAARITRLRVYQARRRLISSSDSESGGPGVIPLRSGAGLKKVGVVPERSVSVAREESLRNRSVAVETEGSEFPPLPPLPPQRRRGD